VSATPPPTPIVLVGSTGSGKSRLAHDLAHDLADVEIATVDSMTVYREMDIGTAKPTSAERAEVRYHLLDLVDPADEYDVAQFQRAARAVAADVARRGRRLLHVGGTGLYGRSVIDDLRIPPRYPELHAQLSAQMGEDPEALWRELRAADPVAASRIDRANGRRIVRALEVTIGSGTPFSSFGPGLRSYPPTSSVQIGIRTDPSLLDAHLDARFRDWMDGGLLDEVRRLAERPRGMSRTARQAVGYRELLEHVEGRVNLSDAVAGAIVATKRLARRQRSWFERDPRVQWYDDSESAQSRIGELLVAGRRAVGE
jgi:tRNA dimethylallyltransferase